METGSGAKSFLAGKPLDMVCVNSTQIYFHFGTNLYLVTEGCYSVLGPDASFEDFRLPDLLQELRHCLDDIVLEAQFTSGDDFKITFVNGFSIIITRQMIGYEFFKIVVGDQDVYVAD